MARKVNVSYESLRQEGREEVLEWLLQHEIINYSKPENSYFYWDGKKEWLLMLPFKRDESKQTPAVIGTIDTSKLREVFMVMHPPAFATQAEEQAKWNEGFVAGMKEVFHEMENTLDVNDPEAPTRKWVEQMSARIQNKYLQGLMGTPFNKNDVPDLLDKFVHFASPRFPSDPPCVNGKVKYIQATKAEPSVVYVKPFGEDYLVRVDVDCYQAKEQIEEYEQHSSH